VTCRHPGFVSQTYRVRPGAITVVPGTAQQVERFAGTYWTEPRCVRCGAPERTLRDEPSRDVPWVETAVFLVFAVVVVVLLSALG